MKVRVTKDCISSGVKQDMSSCPIGLALRRHGYSEVKVDRDAVMIGRGDNVRVLVLPRVARNFIERFDAGHKVQPFTLELELK